MAWLQEVLHGTGSALPMGRRGEHERDERGGRQRPGETRSQGLDSRGQRDDESGADRDADDEVVPCTPPGPIHRDRLCTGPPGQRCQGHERVECGRHEDEHAEGAVGECLRTVRQVEQAQEGAGGEGEPDDEAPEAITEPALREARDGDDEGREKQTERDGFHVTPPSSRGD